VFLFLAVNREVTLQDTCSINMNYTDKYINTNGLSNDTNFDNNAIALFDSRLDHDILNYNSNDNNSAKDANSNNAMIFPNDCDTENNRAKTVNLNVTFSYENNYETVDNNNTNNSTNSNVSYNNVTSRDNGKCHNVINSAINPNNSVGDIDCDNNVILTWDNKYNHNAINYENNVCKPMRHANSDNAVIFPNDCDNEEDSRTKVVNFNVTSSYKNGNSHEMVDNSNNSTNNSTNGNVSNNVTSCNGKCHSVIDNAINAKTTIDDTDCDNNNVILSWNNRRNHNAINDENNVSRSTRHANSDNAILSNDCDKNNGVKTVNLNETFSCDNGNNCETVNDMDVNNFTNINNDSNNKMTCDNGNANNSETDIVLNDVMIFPFDDGNISGILDMNNDRISYNEDNNGVTFSYNDDDIMNNIASANTTNISEYQPSTLENIEQSIHNYIDTSNHKTSLESLIDISSVNTFGCREDNLYVPFSQPKGLKKKNFCYYCKKFQSKIARHLEQVHKSEPEVKKFSLLPKGDHILEFDRNCHYMIHYKYYYI